MLGEDDMIVGDDVMEIVLNNDLERQICDAIDPRFLLQLVSHLGMLYLYFYTSTLISSNSVFTS